MDQILNSRTSETGYFLDFLSFLDFLPFLDLSSLVCLAIPITSIESKGAALVKRQNN